MNGQKNTIITNNAKTIQRGDTSNGGFSGRLVAHEQHDNFVTG